MTDIMEKVKLGDSLVEILVDTSTNIVKTKLYNIESENLIFRLNKDCITIESNSHSDLVKFLNKCRIDDDKIMTALNIAMNTQYNEDGLYLITDNIKCSELDIDKDNLVSFKLYCNNNLEFRLHSINSLEVEDITHHLKLTNIDDLEDDEYTKE